MEERKIAYRIVLGCTLLWCALVVAPPVAGRLIPDSPIPSVVYSLFAHICHQWDSHSLHLFGIKLAVCARCFAVYAGFLAGTVLMPLLRQPRSSPRALWLAAAAPMALDVLLSFSAWYEAGTASRVVTGAWFGVLAAQLLVPLFVRCFTIVLSRPLSPQGLRYERTSR